MNIVLFFEVHLEVHELRPVFDHDLPIAPFDFRPDNMVITSFRRDDTSHFPVMSLCRFVDDDDEVAIFQILFCRSPFRSSMEK